MPCSCFLCLYAYSDAAHSWCWLTPRYVYFDPDALKKHVPDNSKLPASEVAASSRTLGGDNADDGDEDDDNEALDLSALNSDELYKYYINNKRLHGLLDYMYYSNEAFMPFTPMTTEGKSDFKVKTFDSPMTYDQFISLVKDSPKATLNAAGKSAGGGDPGDSDCGFNKSSASKGSKNNSSNHHRNRNSHSRTPATTLTTQSSNGKRSAKEESAGKFYNDSKEDKITFDKFRHITNRLASKAAQVLLPYLDADYPDRLTTSAELLKYLWDKYYDYSSYEKALAEFNNLEMKHGFRRNATSSNETAIPKSAGKATRAFDRPTPDEMREFNHKGRYFTYRKKGYISSKCPHKEKLAKQLDAYLNSIADAI
ncbi:hypothetical protein QBC32DRAFT_374610 [Pseudoneurospora amorphoporcata]|uniref:Uncharacterized protein n=1 Tax=Pseudoneurospora amorphoporcata TaxID=241081 RepID=A0AAN6NLG9_9PEZI|nr:hypothetical protein QBC32DRAFT_374610 [Pseudoneurospora amorphoporcata]